MQNGQPANGDSGTDMLLKQICDDRAYKAFNMLEVINKQKHAMTKEALLSYFRTNKSTIDYDTYMSIVGLLDKKVNIEIQRRTSFYELDDINDI
ncbi:hypothetical protein ENBRE01_0818 [Enteropsectra breve]|nr:hypothetical protein ENBRE01_0818 [Enteropsectra breve]